MLSRIILAAFISAFCLAACNQTAPPSQGATPDVNTQIAALTKRLHDAELRLKGIDSDLQSKTFQLGSLEARQHVSAAFDPADPTFLRVDSQIGPLAVAIVDVAPYGDGVRIKLNLGNPMAAGVAGVTLHMTYGPRRPDDSTGTGANSNWWDQLKSKDVELPSRLKPASWNPTSVVLPGIDPKQFGYLLLSIDATQISLSVE